MIKNNLKQILSTFIILLISFFVCCNLAVAVNLGDAFFGENSYLGKAAGLSGYDTSINEPEPIIAIIINVILIFVGVIFLLLMIYGGNIWMMARGNEEEVKKAKETIKAAIIGLIVVLLAYAISHFVIEMLGKGTLK